jgi:hypothetical protein
MDGANLVGNTCVCPAGAACDVATSVTFIVADADCGPGDTIDLYVGGSLAGTTSAGICDCGVTATTTTITDPSILAALGPPGTCSDFVRVVFNDVANDNVGFVHVLIQRAASGTESLCLADYSFGGCSDDTRTVCYPAYPNGFGNDVGPEFSSPADLNLNGIADCAECATGTVTSGQTCVDACTVNNGGCDPSANCTHDPSTNAVVCACSTGYALNAGGMCVDACTVNNGGCDPSANCTHDPSTYAVVCSCPISGNIYCGVCLDPSGDVNNCGSCGNVCQATDPNASAFCQGGMCGESCNVGTLCGTACVDETSDPNNCGACSNVCTTSDPNATPNCMGSQCGSSCNSGYTSCNSVCVDEQNDSNNCGACGNACGTGLACASGSCADACTVNNGGCGDPAIATCSHDPSSGAVVCGCTDGANLVGNTCVCPAGAACDVATSVTFKVNDADCGDDNTWSFYVNGSSAGTAGSQGCSCGNTATITTVTDPSLLAGLGAPGTCSDAVAVVGSDVSGDYLALIDVQIQRRGSGTELLCLADYYGAGCSNDTRTLCYPDNGSGYTFAAGPEFASPPDANGDLIPDCAQCGTGNVTSGQTCVDACTVNNGGCDPSANCTHDGVTNAVLCTCNTGYALNPGGMCVDACTLNNGGCDPSANCTHDPSTFAVICSCPISGNVYCGACVDPTSDVNNCGSCGNACPVTDPNAVAFCQGGMCGESCTVGSLCGTACVDETSDVNNCGSCGNVCTTSDPNATPICLMSACGSSCNSGYTTCAGVCVNEQSDPNNCGSCGNACDPGTICSGGGCMACGSGLTACNNTCVDETSDVNNCGSCGNVCPTTDPNAVATCQGSLCGETCSVGTLCGTACVDETSDINNCGACGNVCTTSDPNGVASCSSSVCGVTCNTGYTLDGTDTCVDACTINNGGCDTNAACAHDPTTNAIECTCNTGYVDQVYDFSNPSQLGAWTLDPVWGIGASGSQPTTLTNTAGTPNSGDDDIALFDTRFVAPGQITYWAAYNLSGCSWPQAGALVEASTDGFNWTAIDTIEADASSTGEQRTAPFGSLTGSTVQIRFHVFDQCGDVTANDQFWFTDVPDFPVVCLDSCTVSNGGCVAGSTCAHDPSTNAVECTCSAGDIYCGGCVEPSSDRNNCGSCGNACGAMAICSSGTCTGCSSGFTVCGNTCVDESGDPANCGSCGNVCGTTDPNAVATCSGGVCGEMCTVGSLCGTACVDETSDVSNCGACGNVCTTSDPNATPACSASVCGSVCNSGFNSCSGVCVNEQSDPANCGSCGNACPSESNASATCSTGSCGIACNTGFSDCNNDPSDGCEVNTTDDTGNCGNCGNACATRPNAAPTCSNSSCGYACNAGFLDCNGDATDGCEVSELNDSSNCGGCGHVCTTSDPNAGAFCSGGLCTSSCDSGFTSCSGVCVNEQTDLANCGGCGNACTTSDPNATASCSAGICGEVCNSGFTLCNGVCVNEQADPANCGGCGTTCPSEANSTPICSSGSCGIACDTGFADCNNDPSDGCEVSTTDDVNDCNGCGMVCPGRPNASPVCSNSACTFACSAGFADCNHSAADGCETNLNSDAASCGVCGNACTTSDPNAVALCSGGQCGSICSSGFTSCNGVCVNEQSDLNNCGGCGVTCTTTDPEATPECNAGQCGSVCVSGFTSCNGVCVNEQSDLNNCGSCGVACTTSDPNATATCSAGACGSACNAGYTDCGGTCVDEQSDTANCGGCGTTCPSEQNSSPTCSAGSCGIACNAGFADCNADPTDGCEVDTTSNPNDCNACGNVCPSRPNSASTCGNSTCGYACDTGFEDCDGQPADGCEVNTLADGANCGGCGIVCSTSDPNATAVCLAGTCGSACNIGFTLCNGVCVNEQSDALNCGGCGVVCTSSDPNAAVACSAGQCATACDSGFTQCSGSCVDEQSDPANCGTCGNACPSGPNSTATCAQAACGLTCSTGFADCDQDPTNGCEVDTTSSANDCGTCGMACPAVMNAASVCVSSSCAYQCDVGFADCNGLAIDGCEANTLSDAANCGVCGLACTTTDPNAIAFCAAGQCGSSCNSGFTLCNGVCVNEQTDPANCGACGNTCASGADSTATCSQGSCGLSCTTGFADCNQDPSDGCEEDITQNVNNCGTCGNVCPARANAAAVCASSTCGYQCAFGFADCNGAAADGCEVNTVSDALNCGVCGNACTTTDPNATAFCAGSQCGSTCNPGFTLCNGVCVNEQSDAANCGACGNACPSGPDSTATCTQGTCALACDSGFADCDQDPTDGCEVGTSANPADCGICGNVCPVPANAASFCEASLCGYACLTGFADCNAVEADGCEINIASDPANCGGCGITCSTSDPNALATCAMGTCGSMCNPGFTSCNGTCVDETSDVNNCGACGNACATAVENATPACQASTCGYTCNAGLTDCSGICADEQSDPNNCGACGNACASGTCASGQCSPPDAGGPDASTPDASGPADAGVDAGEIDAGEIDAGEIDAGEADAGEVDAGAELDAGTAADAGGLPKADGGITANKSRGCRGCSSGDATPIGLLLLQALGALGARRRARLRAMR